jgi:hypothetical protein
VPDWRILGALKGRVILGAVRLWASDAGEQGIDAPAGRVIPGENLLM